MTIQSPTQIIYDADLLEDSEHLKFPERYSTSLSDPNLLKNPLETPNGEMLSVTVLGKCALSFDIYVRENTSLNYPDEGYLIAPFDPLPCPLDEHSLITPSEPGVSLTDVEEVEETSQKRPGTPPEQSSKKPRLTV